MLDDANYRAAPEQTELLAPQVIALETSGPDPMTCDSPEKDHTVTGGFLTTLAALAGLGLLALFLLWRIAPMVAAGVALFGVILAVIAFWWEPRRLTVTRLTLPVEGLTAPVRAVVVADTQSLRWHWPAKRLARLTRLVSGQNADIVFLLGDYAGWSHGPSRKIYNEWLHIPPEDVIQELGSLSAPMGVYAVLGNHDWWWSGEKMQALFDGTPAHLLLNESRLAAHPETGATLWVAGADDPAGGASLPGRAVQGVDETAPLVFLTHRPDELARMPRRAALSLAGHTHGGQVRFPLVGAPIKLSQNGWIKGLYETDQGPLFVSSGVGTGGIPVRFGVAPEIVVIEMVPAETGAGQ